MLLYLKDEARLSLPACRKPPMRQGFVSCQSCGRLEKLGEEGSDLPQLATTKKVHFEQVFTLR